MTALFVVVVLAGCTSGKKHDTNSSGPLTSAKSAAAPTAGQSNGQGSKTVPAPGGGNISKVISAAPPPTAAAVALTAPARLKTGIVITLARVESINVGASGPGEVGGPSLAVTVHVVNGSTRSIDLSSAVVTLLDSKGDVGQPTPASPAAPFDGPIKPKAAADGVYVFNIAKSRRNPVNVYVSYSAEAPTAHFVGVAR